MDFDGDYWNATDKKMHEEFEIPGKDIGISHGVGDVAQGLKTDIFAGASRVELGFMVSGKGSRISNQPSPESYDVTERQEMRDLARINNVEISTHVNPNMMGLAGFDARQGNFSEEAAEQSLQEIKRTVEFAADVSNGGPVVVHTGEFQRPIFEADSQFDLLTNTSKTSGKSESVTAPIMLVDKENGKLLAIPRDQRVAWVDKKEINGKRNGEYERIESGEHKGDYNVQMKTVGELAEKYGAKNDPGKFYQEILSRERETYEFEEKRRRREAQDMEAKANLIEKAIIKKKSELEKIENSIKNQQFPEELRNQLINKKEELMEELEQAPSTMKELRDTKVYYEEAERAAARQKAQIDNQIKNVDTVENYALKNTAKNLATAALYAWEVEKKKGLDNPLFIAPENVFPEAYGSHPQELKKIVIDSRQEMTNILKQKGYSQDEAAKISEDHIKATLDSGHLNFWRKYYKGDDEGFKEWYAEQVKDLAKSKILGNIHLHDNFGYQDEHLNFGQGNSPIKELMESLKEGGYKGQFIGEPGGQREGKAQEAWTSVMGMSSSPIYRTDMTSRRWTDVEGSYFGRTYSPAYLVGENMVPNKDDFTLWSGTRLE